jgi:hypothetical protein
MSTHRIIFTSLIFLCATNLPALSAQASFAPTLVIADTALDSTTAEFSKNIVLELCILEWSTCPNGDKFMQGKGSANLPAGQILNNGFNHGTQMVSAAVRTNPDLNIIFIRITGNSSSGLRLTSGDFTVAKMLDWVSNNKESYNIQAVVMSQGHHNLSSLSDYCPRSFMVEGVINKLYSQQVPIFLPAGNRGDKSRIDWPACLPLTFGIGALDQSRSIASYTNLDKNLIDYFELGNLRVLDANGTERNSEGTSISAQIAAAKWMQIRSKNLEKTFAETKMIFDSNTHNVSISLTSSAKAINRDVYDPGDFDAYLAELGKLRQAIEELKWLLQTVRLSRISP